MRARGSAGTAMARLFNRTVHGSNPCCGATNRIRKVYPGGYEGLPSQQPSQQPGSSRRPRIDFASPMRVFRVTKSNPATEADFISYWDSGRRPPRSRPDLERSFRAISCFDSPGQGSRQGAGVSPWRACGRDGDPELRGVPSESDGSHRLRKRQFRRPPALHNRDASGEPRS